MPHTHPAVLIVEDDDEVREVLALYLSREGYAVETARDGAEALERMRVTHPCIVVLDLEMPVMAGAEFRRAQLADPQLRDIPVIVCSAAIDVDDAATKLGAIASVEKPITVGVLMAAIREHCLK